MSDWLPRTIIAPVSDQEREAVRTAQRALRIDVTGEMDDATRSALRGAQKLFGLDPSGVLDKATAGVLDRLRPSSLRE